MEFVKEFQLRADIIEKDYVLGWILAGIAQQTELMENLIFKGGTCLKKCFFETYRFSEDLDYTVLNDEFMDTQNLINIFKKISIWVHDETGVEIPEDSIYFEKYRNNAGKESIEGRIGYIGPVQRRNSIARIKLDLTSDELLVSEPEYRQVHHLYSDRPKTGIRAKCYTFSELFAEKIRALSERLRPRDLYDVIHIYRHAFLNTKPTKILSILEKNVSINKFQYLLLS
jgi:predicted nucleotidyltransferase component of viral defense system